VSFCAFLQSRNILLPAAVLLLSGAVWAADTLPVVTLNVIATDHSGKPVTDLKPDELRVVDDSAVGQITALQPNQGNRPEPLIIFLDLLDLGQEERGAITQRLKDALASVPATDPVYIYVQASDGSVHPVVPVNETDLPPAADMSKGEQVAPLLKQALNKYSDPRHVNFRYETEHIQANLDGLFALARQISVIPGRKQILWITYGIPSQLRTQGSWIDLAPQLRNEAARLNSADIALYTVDPGLALASLRRDGSEILSAATGGRIFATSDLKMAISQARSDGLSNYVLAYQAPASAGKSKEPYHTLKLTCDRKGVKLVAQQVYLPAGAR
jgi:VWFA-related protein